MKKYINKLKEIDTLVELSIGTTMTEEKATEIYALTNELMCDVKKLNFSTEKQSWDEIDERINRVNGYGFSDWIFEFLKNNYHAPFKK